MRKHLVHIKHGTAITIAIIALIVILWPLYNELASPGVHINQPFKTPSRPEFAQAPDFNQLNTKFFNLNQPLTTTDKVEFNTAGDQLAYKAAAGWLVALKSNNPDLSKLILQLQTANYPAYLSNGRIVIGPYVEQLQAKAIQEKILHELHISGEIIGYDPLK